MQAACAGKAFSVICVCLGPLESGSFYVHLYVYDLVCTVCVYVCVYVYVYLFGVVCASGYDALKHFFCVCVCGWVCLYIQAWRDYNWHMLKHETSKANSSVK